METQKIANLLNDSDSETLKFATRKWYCMFLSCHVRV